PLIAMQFTHAVRWDMADFALFGTLLLGAGGAYELAIRRAAHNTYRAAVGVALATAFILVWVNGAVGVIGDEDNPANSMYAGVLAVALIGSVLARLRPWGMARA